MTSSLFNLSFMGFTISALGKIFVAYTAIMVHHRFRKEHRVDERVFVVMRRENFFGVLGLIMIIAGYFMEIPSRLL